MKIKYACLPFLLMACNDFNVLSNGRLVKIQSHRVLIDSNFNDVGVGTIDFIVENRKHSFSIIPQTNDYLFVINCNNINDSISSKELNYINWNGDFGYFYNRRFVEFKSGMKCKYLMKGKMKVYLMSTGFFSG